MERVVTPGGGGADAAVFCSRIGVKAPPEKSSLLLPSAAIMGMIESAQEGAAKAGDAGSSRFYG